MGARDFGDGRQELGDDLGERFRVVAVGFGDGFDLADLAREDGDFTAFGATHLRSGDAIVLGAAFGSRDKTLPTAKAMAPRKKAGSAKTVGAMGSTSCSLRKKSAAAPPAETSAVAIKTVTAALPLPRDINAAMPAAARMARRVSASGAHGARTGVSPLRSWASAWLCCHPASGGVGRRAANDNDASRKAVEGAGFAGGNLPSRNCFEAGGAVAGRRLTLASRLVAKRMAAGRKRGHGRSVRGAANRVQTAATWRGRRRSR